MGSVETVTEMNFDSNRTHRRRSRSWQYWFRLGLIVLACTAIGTLLLIWFVAVPMEAVCPAIGGSGDIPPCSAADRAAAGVAWSLVVAGCYVLASAALLLGRRRSR